MISRMNPVIQSDLPMKLASLASITLFLLSACAHTQRATVAMKVNESEAHVGLGSGEVKPGDRIALFKNKCERPLGGIHQGVHNDPVCRKVEIGEGQITEVLNSQFSIARINPGVDFDEGTVVEKK